MTIERRDFLKKAGAGAGAVALGACSGDAADTERLVPARSLAPA